LVSAGVVSAWTLLIVSAVLGIRHLQLAVLLWVATAALSITPLYVVQSSTIQPGTAVLSVLLVIWGVQVLWQRNDLGRSPLELALVAFIVVAIASCVQGMLWYDANVPGVHRSVGIEIYATALVVLSPATALLVASQLGAASAQRWLYRIFVGLCVLILVSLSVPWLRWPRWWPLIVAHACALIYARLVCDPPLRFTARAVAVGLIVCALAEIVILPFFAPVEPQWISAWLMLVAPLAIITCWYVGWRLVFAAVPAVALLGYACVPFVQNAVTLARAEGDFGRLEIWRDAMTIAAQRPLLGVGPGNYLDYAIVYGHQPLFGSAHGNYQQVAAEMGVIGLAAFLWVLACALFVAWRLVKSLRDPFMQALALGAASSLTGQVLAAVLGDYLVPAYHNGGHTTICVTVYSWVLIGCMLALDRNARAADAVDHAPCLQDDSCSAR
jgi:O-antigen ligase